MLRTNNIHIIGKLVAVDLRTGNRASDGVGYVSATATISTILDGRSNEYEVTFYSSALTQDGKENKLYQSYIKMEDLLNKKVEITGELRENRYYSTKNEQMASAQLLSGRFIKGVSETTADLATFEIGGFVVSELKERTNKNNEIYRYDLSLGQANYSGDMMSMFTLHVNPTDTNIVNGARGYQVGNTVLLRGNLRFIVETVETELKNEGGFGDPVTRVFTNRQKNLYIKNGSAAITDEDKMYNREVIKNLIEVYKANDVTLMNDAKERNSKPVAEKPTVTVRQTSLI